jgi:hypothetical protein
MQFNHTATAAGAGPGVNAGAGNTFKHLGMMVASNAPDCVVNLETSPDGATWTVADIATGGNRWAVAGLNAHAQYVRSNVTNIGSPVGGRSDTGCSTNTTTTVTDPKAVAADAGKTISGPGIPAGATITTVTAGTGYVISAAATATASGLTFVVGAVTAVSTTITYTNLAYWSWNGG